MIFIAFHFQENRKLKIYFFVSIQKLESFKLMMLIWKVLRMLLHRGICYFKTIFYPLS